MVVDVCSPDFELHNCHMKSCNKTETPVFMCPLFPRAVFKGSLSILFGFYLYM